MLLYFRKKKSLKVSYLQNLVCFVDTNEEAAHPNRLLWDTLQRRFLSGHSLYDTHRLPEAPKLHSICSTLSLDKCDLSTTNCGVHSSRPKETQTPVLGGKQAAEEDRLETNTVIRSTADAVTALKTRKRTRRPVGADGSPITLPGGPH